MSLYLIRVIFQKKRAAAGRRYHGSTSNESPLNEFFTKYYPNFQYDPTESASHEFYRLCDEFGWDRDDVDRADAHEEFKDALVKQFNEVYGTDEDDLGDWQNLCLILQIDPAPDDLDGCREVVSKMHVNLVDLVDADVTGEVRVLTLSLN
ncbi:hypothetical protein JVU11DRAFT_8258 [Chiua virens]|nr:hypothetical protein JVU11DRAFT_8258 [Chiua virens]